MARLVVLNGSPRPMGNSAFLAGKAIAAADGTGASSTRFDVAHLSIAPCKGCDACRRNPERGCAIKDDMGGIVEELQAADALLIATPVYWFSLGAQIKACIDRLYAPWNADNAFMKGKRIGAALVYGDADLYRSGGINAVSTIEHMCRVLDAELRGFAYGTANGPGDAAKNTSLVTEVEELARSLLRR